jgi:long-chain acyl-CoA synthetase
MGCRDFQTLTELFLRAVEKHSKPDAFLSKASGAYRGVSSREALRQVAGLAAGLERLGVRRGDRVALLAENRVEWAVTDFALLGLGAVNVPLYPTLLEPDIEFILRDSGAKGMVVSTAAQLWKIVNLRSRLPELRFVLVMDRVGFSGSAAQDWGKIVRDELNRFTDPIAAFRARAGEVRPEDAASILYTSGTMGQPKGVILTHANFASNVQACQERFALGPGDVGLSFLPLSHVFERMLDYFFFWRGVSIAYPEGLEALPRNLMEVRPTVMAVVPRLLEKTQDRIVEAVRQTSARRQRLFQWAVKVGYRFFPYQLEGRTPSLSLRLQHTLADALILSKVRTRLGGRLQCVISGGAALARELGEFFHAVGVPVYEGYGLTETSPVIAVNYPGHVKLGTVGPPIPGVEVKLSEERVDEEAGTGREILARGPNITPGYYRLEEENQQAFVEGWFRTGDLGTLDADGYLAITGRKKNLFKTTAGKYVSPEKLENLFQGHPYVAQIMVLGDGRRFVSALIVPNFGRLEACVRKRGINCRSREELTAHPEIQAFVARQVEEATPWLGSHEKIRRITLLSREFTIESGELTATQKIRRRVVEEHYRDLVERMYRRSSVPSKLASAPAPL